MNSTEVSPERPYLDKIKQYVRVFLEIVPLGLIVIVAVFSALYPYPHHDFGSYYIPAGQLILRGADPYILNETQGPFIYPPVALWAFALMALANPSFVLMLIVTLLASVRIIRLLKVSTWWLTYPALVHVVYYGQIDILVLWLTVEAYAACKHRWSFVPMAVAIAIKPQTALFWFVPYMYGLPSNRERLRVIRSILLVFFVPLLVWFVVAPDTFAASWRSWLFYVQKDPGYYVFLSASFFAVGAPLLSAVALLIWPFVRDHHISRPLFALGMPAARHYNMVGLIGAAPIGFIAISYFIGLLIAATGISLFWVESVLIIVWRLWTRFREMQQPETALAHEQAA